MSALLLPPEKFYWSVLEAPQWRPRRGGALPPGLRPALEEDLPLPAEEVHAVCVPLPSSSGAPGGRLLVCAAPRALLESVDPMVRSLRPQRVPECLGADLGGSALASLEMLGGEYEPRTVRRARAARHAIAAVVALACAALLALGLSRRAGHERALASAAASARAELLERVAPSTSIVPTSAADTLAMDVLKLRRSVELAAKVRPQPDAAAAAAALLKAWPAAVPSTPQSLLISGAAATVSVSMEGDASAYLAAFKPPPGWTMDEPRLNAGDRITRLTLQLRIPEDRP